MGATTNAARRRGGRAGRDQRGAAAVEFALVLPILLLLVFGIIAYGYMLSFRGSMSQAAAEGARAAAVHQAGSGGSAQESARAALNEALGVYGVSCTPTGALQRRGDTAGSCDVSAPTNCGSGSPQPQCVTVRLTYDYEDRPLIPLPFVGGVMPDEIEYAASARVS
ncbi:pilus assembly protein [Nocardioides sp. ChNu-153]|uniref:TadE/TadG family type IV pilus assembly protein n=1 Tax=unclassified Nocardioides TaxID=2615069 RepID=UPI002404AF2A|nr:MULTISPECIES: TadE/TadG family type IV pilus assembly protein [unclassified Nocardioides]MDF9716920.1 pilus assembly protein [Nocardioides sp. ChNu-99]MDN7122612.1 pilus assembly protein [Nocardioides sp. ChNu-153]